MKNISIQTNIGWCNVHALANVLRDKDFLEYLSNEEYKSGDTDSLTEMLHGVGYDSYEMHGVVGISEEYPPIPDGYLMDVLTSDNSATVSLKPIDYPVIPYFLTVQLAKPKWHTVAFLKCNDRYLYIDSYREDVVVLDYPQDILCFFHCCINVERIVQTGKSGGCWLIFDGESLGFSELLKGFQK